jgi:tetrahydromethanopterin S-methyltransferase subunit B
MILYLAIFFAGMVVGQAVHGFLLGKQVSALADLIKYMVRSLR